MAGTRRGGALLRLGITLFCVSVPSAVACFGPAAPDASGGAQTDGGSRGDAGASPLSGGAGSGGDPAMGGLAGSDGTGGTMPTGATIGRPLTFAPTSDGFGISVIWIDGDPTELVAEVRPDGEQGAWSNPGPPSSPASDLAEWRVEGLEAGTRYEFRILREQGEEREVIASGSAVTQRPPGKSFTFGLISDTHIPPRSIAPGDNSQVNYQETTLALVAKNLAPEAHDFVVNLGDMLDFHLFGFNSPPPSGSYTREGYVNYRRLLGDVLAASAHFPVVGNWEGENGDYTEEQITRSREQRKLYAPGPAPDTYPEGGSPHQDYYAFEWGDALFITLNVMTYTPTPHLLTYYKGEPDDWTLGEEQLAWFEETLKNAKSKWRFVLIHHAVGGQAGTEYDSAYGRGGGQAARVGEQAVVHDLMLEHGVQIFFYGHDHVFTDMVVDGIHYTLPGSAGAPWKFDALYTGYQTFWSDSGHGRVEVTPDKVRVEFVAIDGKILLRYEI